MVEVWKKQAETAAKVTAAIAAPKGDPEKGMSKLGCLLIFFLLTCIYFEKNNLFIEIYLFPFQKKGGGECWKFS